MKFVRQDINLQLINYYLRETPGMAVIFYDNNLYTRIIDYGGEVRESGWEVMRYAYNLLWNQARRPALLVLAVN